MTSPWQQSFALPDFEISNLGGWCPCQGFGTARGLDFYFRARNGGWTLVLGWPGEDIAGCTYHEPGVVWQTEGEDISQGFMSRQVAFALITSSLGWRRGFLPTACVLEACP